MVNEILLTSLHLVFFHCSTKLFSAADDCENDTVISPERIDCNEKVIPTSNTLPNLQQLSLKENVDGKKQNTSSAVDISSIERLALDNETGKVWLIYEEIYFTFN